MQVRFSHELDVIAGYARDEAMRTGWYGIGEDHLFLGILRHADNDVCCLLRGLEISLQEFKDYIDSFLMCRRPVPYNAMEEVRLTRGSQNAMNLAVYEALKYGSPEVLASHLFLALLRDGASRAGAYLADFGYDYASIGAMMAQQDMLGAPSEASAKPKTPVKAIDLTGALSEQLGKLFGGGGSAPS